MIYLALIFFYALLGVSFIIKDKFIGIFSGFGISIVGIYIAINGIQTLNTLLVQTTALISIAFGVYIILAGSIDDMAINMEVIKW